MISPVKAKATVRVSHGDLPPCPPLVPSHQVVSCSQEGLIRSLASKREKGRGGPFPNINDEFVGRHDVVFDEM